MYRALVLAFLALFACSCGGFGPVREVGGRRVGVEPHTVGPVRLVGFVNVKDSIVDADAGADFAMVLPGGDWLAKVNAAIVRLSPDGRSVRWSKTGLGVWDAVAGPADRVICVGEIADPKALNGAARALFALDTRTGALVWRIEADPIVRGASAKLARVGTITVAASAYGEAAVDDAGKLAWVAQPRERSDDPLIAPIAGGVVVVSTPERFAGHFVGAAPLHRPLVMRTLAIATGEQRGRFELAAEGDFYALGELGFSGDGRIAVQVGDVRVKVEPWTSPQGEPSTMQTNVSTVRIVELDARDLVAPVARARALPHEEPSAMPGALAGSEVVFVDRYATEGAALGMLIVDLEGVRARRVPLLQTAKHHAHVQFTQLGVRADQISFAGQFTGSASPLRARVEKVDWCEAQRGVECFGSHDDVTLSPTAGVIGTVRFEHGSAHP